MELAHKARSAGKRFAGVIVEPDHNGLEALSALVQSGKLEVHVEHVFSTHRGRPGPPAPDRSHEGKDRPHHLIDCDATRHHITQWTGAQHDRR
jgi:hypothetical protein